MGLRSRCFAPSLFHQRLDEELLASLNNRVAFGFQPAANVVDSAWVLGIQFTLSLHRAPVGRDAGAALLFVFVGCVGRDPCEDACRQGARDRGSVLLGQLPSNFIDRDELPLLNGLHDLINFDGSSNQHRALTPLRHHLSFNRLKAGKALAVLELLLPRTFGFRSHCGGSWLGAFLVLGSSFRGRLVVELARVPGAAHATFGRDSATKLANDLTI